MKENENKKVPELKYAPILVVDDEKNIRLTGVLLEIQGNLSEARRFFRAALDIDPAYKPARSNLDRTASPESAAGGKAAANEAGDEE